MSPLMVKYCDEFGHAFVCICVEAEIARRLYDLPDNFAPIPRIKEKAFAGKSIPGLKLGHCRRKEVHNTCRPWIDQVLNSGQRVL
eukprot:5982710-Amphidinium_carterae.1